MRAKYLSRAFKQYALSVQLAPPHHFDKEIARESDRIHKFLLFKINDRTDDLEVIQQIYELLQESVPNELPEVKDFIQDYLFETYYKQAVEVQATCGEKSTALKYLQLCNQQSLRVKGVEDPMINVKINEIKKYMEKRDKERKLKKAAHVESKADNLLSRGLYEKAAKKYQKVIELCKDRSAEAEARAQLKLGRLYFEKLKDYDKARIHLVDYQLLTFVVKVRTDDIAIGFQQARKMMQIINSVN